MKTYYIMDRNSISGKAGKEDWVKAFTDRAVCKAECLDKEEEFVSYEVLNATGEEISGDRVIVANTVLSLDRREWDDYARERALKKLTPEERKLLNLTNKTK